jgi:hypothetical protein
MKRKRSECQLFIDLPHSAGKPQVGHVIVSRGIRGFGTAYLILKIREVRRRKASMLARFQMFCARVSMKDLQMDGVSDQKLWLMKWYKRDPKPRSQAGMEFYTPQRTSGARMLA